MQIPKWGGVPGLPSRVAWGLPVVRTRQALAVALRQLWRAEPRGQGHRYRTDPMLRQEAQNDGKGPREAGKKGGKGDGGGGGGGERERGSSKDSKGVTAAR